MSKTIILDDETYNKLKKKAADEDRSMSKMAKILFDRALSLSSSAGTTPAPQQPAPQPSPQPSLSDMMWASYVQSNGTVFDESTHFATADEAIDFFAKSSKPIHLANSDVSLRLRDLIEYSDEMIRLRKECDRLDREIDEDDSSDWQKLAMELQEAKAKIGALVNKADNFMDNYQGLTAQ